MFSFRKSISFKDVKSGLPRARTALFDFKPGDRVKIEGCNVVGIILNQGIFNEKGSMTWLIELDVEVHLVVEAEYLRRCEDS